MRDEFGSDEDNPYDGEDERNSGIVENVYDILGKIWTLPNTVVGLVYGTAGYIAGSILGTNPSVNIGHNAIQFHNNPLMHPSSAITLGNTISYGIKISQSSRGAYGDPNVRFGPHEEIHTYQYQKWGPFFGPAYVLEGIVNGWGTKNRFEQEAQSKSRYKGC